MTELDTMRRFALDLAEAGGAIARRAWLGDLSVRYKADGSALTQADLDIEALWRDRISQAFPDHGILGEEYGAETGASAYTWVLDPVDGTRPFGAGLLNYASLISLCRDGVPVLGLIDLPLEGAQVMGLAGQGCTFAGRPVRTSGRAEFADAVIALANPESFAPESRAGFTRLQAEGRQRVYDGGSPAYGALARGLVDVCLNGDDLDAFDICALVPLVEGAGGVISDWEGGALGLASSGRIVASSSPALHDLVLARLTDEGV